MAFNIALSGLKASAVDLDVTGNNIANASTVGFKASRVQFGDLYASGFLNASTNPVGSGVRVQDVQQRFIQGGISFTDSGLDMAINGEGFFILNNGGEIRYTRAGQFGVDKDGFIVNNQGMRAQGFLADNDGNLTGVRGDLSIDTSNLPPRRTTNVDGQFNLDAREGVLAVRGTTLVSDGAQAGAVTAGSTNGFPSESYTITYPDGRVVPLAPTDAGASAGAIASFLSQREGVAASARTVAVIEDANFNPTAGDQLNINGVPFVLGAGGLAQLANDINSSSLVGTNAVFDGNDLQIISTQGADLRFQFAGTGSVAVNGSSTPATSQTLAAGNTTATVAGRVTVTLDDGVTIQTPGGSVIFDTVNGTPFVNNTFDPSDQRTYNHATSTTIYDSLGNPHVMTTFFVKEPATGPNPANLWTTYVQIDGRDVGDPNTALPPPQNVEPTRASYNLVFNNDGTLNRTLSDEILISNWIPLDPDGSPNGASGPLNVINGGTLPIPDPPNSSNFAIDLGRTTQFGSSFAVNDLRQNGFTTGRLSGLDVSNEGILFARYSNGQSQTLGQVALATFRNAEGLSPVGETTWVETFASGNPVIGGPETGTLGSIKASSIEESNVDLSAELVNLIIAQRNFQANAKTIETSDSITQTIINLR